MPGSRTSSTSRSSSSITFKKDQGLDGEPEPASAPPPLDHADVDVDELDGGARGRRGRTAAESIEPIVEQLANYPSRSRSPSHRRAAATSRPRDARGNRARGEGGAAGAAGAGAAGARRPAHSRRPSTTATRATACGSTRPWPRTTSTPSTGRVIARCRSRSSRTRSRSGAVDESTDEDEDAG